MDGSVGMLDFIQAHLIDNLPRAKILLRQRNKMAIEVRLDLTFGRFGHARTSARARR